MEARKRLTSRRALLPQDIQVIETLGITPDEYYDFLDQCEYACRERGEEYSHVPNVVNGPIAPVLIQVAIGVALTVVSSLLAPKPKSPDEKKRLEPINTADKTGKNRFTPYNDFDSIQELATLGTVVPLVYSNGTNGVRVNTQLLWSNVETVRRGQVAKVLLLISQGKLAGTPGFGGIAIGDTLLENFQDARLRVWYNNGNGRSRINNKNNVLKEGGKAVGSLRGVTVPSDVFSLKEYRNSKYYPWFSGTRTSTTSTEFGLFNVTPNGNHYKVDYELILVNDNTERDVKEGQREKINKRDEEYPVGAGIVEINRRKWRTGDATNKAMKVEVGQEIRYQIRKDESFGSYGGGRWGLDDVINATSQRRAAADDIMALGRIYHIGSAQFVCINEPPELWELNSNTANYALKCIDPGIIKYGYPTREVDNWRTYNLAEISNGIITTNRPDDDIIDIGLKSTVWKRVSGFPNVNSQPSQRVIDQYSDGGGSITLGSMNTYLFRMSCFKIFIRPIDSNRWIDLWGGTAFCIKHNNPSEVFNSFRIELPGVATSKQVTEYEIKFMPVAGNYVIENFKKVMILDTRKKWNSTAIKTSGGTYRLWFRGYWESINIANCSNPEFIIGPKTDVGMITKLSPSSGGKIPDENKVTCDTQYYKRRPSRDSSPESYVRYRGPQENKGGDRSWYFVYKGQNIKRIRVRGSNRDPGEVKANYKGKTYYFRKGALKESTGSTKYYEIERCRKDIDSLGKQTTTISPNGGSGTGAKFKYTTYKNGAWEVDIVDPGRGYKNGQSLYLRVPGPDRKVRISTNTDTLFKVNPYDMIKDYAVYDSESFSNESGPEHSISYVNEIRKPDGPAPDYDDLATLGLWISSAVDITDISQVSVYVNRGIEGRTWTGSKSYSAISFLPEIIFDLLSNKEYGLGGIVGKRGVNEGEMSRTTRYCKANGFGWDGVIKDRVNIREWIFEQAAYVMCDFCIQGGKFFIKPSFPIHSDYRIHSHSSMTKRYTRPVTIKALFTDGNIRNTRVTFLPPEERQMFIAQVLYREEDPNGFPKIVTKTVGLSKNPEVGSDTPGRDDDPMERFDMTAFCHSESHAEKFARYALRVRQLVTHTVTFQSTPESCRNLAPGDYVRYISTVTHMDRFATGTISNMGTVQCHLTPGQIKGKRIMYWRVGSDEGIRETTLDIGENGLCNNDNHKNSVFVLLDRETKSRVYKVESLQYSDEGLVDLTLTEAPVDTENRLLTLDWRDKDFYEYD